MPELLDIYDDNGRHVGTKDREAVHQDGDWHKCFHLWVIGMQDSEMFVVMQRRADDKDSFPGMLDITAAGHLAAGETFAHGIREAEEEIGLRVKYEDVTVLGTRPVVGIPYPGFINREFDEIALYRNDRPIQDYRFDHGELAGIVRVPFWGLCALVNRQVDVIYADEFDGTSTSEIAIKASDIVQNGYLPVLMIMIERYFKGTRPLAI